MFKKLPEQVSGVTASLLEEKRRAVGAAVWSALRETGSIYVKVL